MSNLQRSLYESQRRFDVGMITRADLAQVLAQVAQGTSRYYSSTIQSNDQ
jgi:outer membrane protein TolC